MEPPVVVDVLGRRIAELPDRLVNVVGALVVVGTYEPVGSAKDVPPGVVGKVFELRPGRLLDETTDEVIVFESVEIVDGDTIVDSVATEVDSPLPIVTTLVETGYDG